MRASRTLSVCIAIATLMVAGAGVNVAAAATRPTVAAGGFHTIGLAKNGSVVAAGLNSSGETNVSGWTDIVAVAGGGYFGDFTVGVKSNGTVVATGVNTSGQCNVSGWTGIIGIAPNPQSDSTVGWRSNGSVEATGRNDSGQCNVGSWSSIKAVACGFRHTVGVKVDGTVVATGSNADGQCNVSGWTNTTAIAAGEYHSVGVKGDGTVVATGSNTYGQCNVSGWTNVVAASAGSGHTVALRADGTVVATGDNISGQCNVSGWKDIVAIAAGASHTVGLKSDGTVVACGYNGGGQTSVSAWRLADVDDNIPGVPLQSWQTDGSGSKATDTYDVYAVYLTKDELAQFNCFRTSGDANFNIFLYPPGANDIWRFEQWLPGYAWAKSGDQTETINYVPTETGTHYLLVDASSGAGSYRITAPVPGTVTGVVALGGTGLAGVSVSIPGVGSTSTGADGTYTVADIPLGTYAATYSKPGFVAQTHNVTITTGGTLTRSVDLIAITGLSRLSTSPPKPTHGKYASFTAYLTPGMGATAGTTNLALYRYETKTVRKKVRGKWKKVKVKYWRLRATKTMTPSSDGRLSLRYKLPYSGKWKMIASYSGSPAYKPSVSGEKTFTVK